MRYEDMPDPRKLDLVQAHPYLRAFPAIDQKLMISNGKYLRCGMSRRRWTGGMASENM